MRVIGVMVMIYGDDKGFVFLLCIVKIQVILIFVGLMVKIILEDKEKYFDCMYELLVIFKKVGVCIEIDICEGYILVWKFNDWEMKGVFVRFEFGFKDVVKDVVFFVCCDIGEKGIIFIGEFIIKVLEFFEIIQ